MSTIYRHTEERHYAAGLVGTTNVGPFEIYTHRNPADRALTYWRFDVNPALVGAGFSRNGVETRVFFNGYRRWPRWLRVPLLSGFGYRTWRGELRHRFFRVERLQHFYDAGMFRAYAGRLFVTLRAPAWYRRRALDRLLATYEEPDWDDYPEGGCPDDQIEEGC